MQEFSQRLTNCFQQIIYYFVISNLPPVVCLSSSIGNSWFLNWFLPCFKFVNLLFLLLNFLCFLIMSILVCLDGRQNDFNLTDCGCYTSCLIQILGQCHDSLDLNASLPHFLPKIRPFLFPHFLNSCNTFIFLLLAHSTRNMILNKINWLLLTD